MLSIPNRASLKRLGACDGGYERFCNAESSDILSIVAAVSVSDILWFLSKKKRTDIVVAFAKTIAESVSHLQNGSYSAVAANEAVHYAATAPHYAADAAAHYATFAAAAHYAVRGRCVAAHYAADAAARKLSTAFAKCKLVELINDSSLT